MLWGVQQGYLVMRDGLVGHCGHDHDSFHFLVDVLG